MPPLTITDIAAYQFASGEDGPSHHDYRAAQVSGYPCVYSVGMLHGGAMATYAVNWLGPENVRRFGCRFVEMQLPGDLMARRSTHGGHRARLQSRGHAAR